MNNRSRAIDVVLGAGVILALFTAATGSGRSGRHSASETVRASRFIVVDSAGEERAELGVAADGQIRLSMRGSDPKKRSIWVGINERGAATLGVYGAGDKALVEMGSLDGETSAVVLRNAKGQKRIGLVAAPASGVLVNDASGRTRCSLEVRQDGSPWILLHDAAKEPRVSLGIDPKGAAALDLRDASGKTRVVADVGANEGNVAVLDTDGRVLWAARR